MKVVDLAVQTQNKEESNFSKQIGRLNPFAADKSDGKATSVVIKIFERILDNQFVLLTNLNLPGSEAPIPMVLIGPPGIWVINATAVKGIFKATEDTWEIMDDRFRRYRLAKPNLLNRTLSMADAVGEVLAEHDLKLERIDSALFLTDPGVHVDTARPKVRIVLVDGLERFGFNLLQSRAIWDKAAIHQVSRALAGEGHPALEPKTLEDERDAFSFRESIPENPTQLPPNIIYDRSESAMVKNVPLSAKQLVVLGFMAIVDIAVLVALVILVLSNS